MSSNDRYAATLDGTMLPAMMHALMIAQTSARMSGSPGIALQFKRMVADLAAQSGIPDLHHHVDDDDWFRACKAMVSAKAYHWHTKTGWSGENGDVTLIVDGRQFRHDRHLAADNPLLPAIQEFMERYAHVAAVKGEPVSDWRDYAPPSAEDAPEPPAP